MKSISTDANWHLFARLQLQSSNHANIQAGMDQQHMIEDIEARAKAAGVSMRQVCESAGIHPTTFSRWKVSEKNPEPIGATLASLNKLDAALRKAEAGEVERDAA